MNSIMKKNVMKTNNNIIHIPHEQALAECFLSLLVSAPNFSVFFSASSVALVKAYMSSMTIINNQMDYTLLSPRIMSCAMEALLFSDLAIAIMSSASLSCIC